MLWWVHALQWTLRRAEVPWVLPLHGGQRTPLVFSLNLNPKLCFLYFVLRPGDLLLCQFSGFHSIPPAGPVPDPDYSLWQLHYCGGPAPISSPQPPPLPPNFPTSNCCFRQLNLQIFREFLGFQSVLGSFFLFCPSLPYACLISLNFPDLCT